MSGAEAGQPKTAYSAKTVLKAPAQRSAAYLPDPAGIHAAREKLGVTLLSGRAKHMTLIRIRSDQLIYMIDASVDTYILDSAVVFVLQ
jgi:hypothetical protein